jgi:hypothetical protein
MITCAETLDCGSHHPANICTTQHQAQQCCMDRPCIACRRSHSLIRSRGPAATDEPAAVSAFSQTSANSMLSPFSMQGVGPLMKLVPQPHLRWPTGQCRAEHTALRVRTVEYFLMA